MSLTALLLIDLQQGMHAPTLPPRNHPDAEAHAAQLLAHWRSTAQPIVHIRHLSRQPGSVFWPGQPGCEFQPAFMPRPNEAVFEKNVPDAFALSGLERWLHARGITRLVVAGVATNNSVEATARSAGCLGFATTVVEDACFCFEQRDLNGRRWSAEEVHALSLSNLSLDYAVIRSTQHLLAE